ncbi:arginine transporter [Rhodosalinus halophilus]|uniref:Arginine transporter n=1 Tax=Rhodosalinus halophilus TaxID=2259333 RepID=A0A365UBG6_9RHOB|nr:arginine transporter [Rhodosalinus halophilus]RBI86622.1 arginine transporter [Rhodosalinus halophilus]
MTGAGRAVLAAGLMLTLAACGGGRLESSCLASGRAAANPAVCGCIQAVADRELSRADQRLAASFYANPQRAQDIRQSDNPSREAFWSRYRAFGEAVERSCGRYR